MPANQNTPQANAGPAGNNQPANPWLTGPTLNAPAAGNQPAPVQRIQGGALNPNQLRDAYNKLKEERREDYIKQQQLDAAEREEKEDEDV